MKYPNILFIITDQQRFDSLGCYGVKAIQTPNLDRLAREGVLFEHCYVNNPICTPSRASMLTGKPLPGHGVYRLNDLLPNEFNNLWHDRQYENVKLKMLHRFMDWMVACDKKYIGSRGGESSPVHPY